MGKPTTYHHVVLFESIASDLLAFGYSIQKNAMPAEVIVELYKIVQSMQADELKLAGIGRSSGQNLHQDIRRDKIAWIESTEGARGQWMQFSEQLQQHLNRTLMLGLFSFESHFAHYAPGAFYKKHVDAFQGQANRVLSVVLYLNPHWESNDGGEMVLYSEADPLAVLCDVIPEGGTLAVFLSESFPHEVRPARRDRYSIAGWYRVNTSNKFYIDPPQ